MLERTETIARRHGSLAAPPIVEELALQYNIVAQDAWDDVYISLHFQSSVHEREGLLRAFEQLADLLASEKVEVLQEKIYGLVSAQKDILHAREQAYLRRGLDPHTPVTFVDGAPCTGGLISGVQVIGIARGAQGVRVETVRDQDQPIGRELHAPGRRVLFLSGISGIRHGLTSTVTEQAARMFSEAGRVLEARGYRPQQIARTWIYLPRLLDWYGELNRVRTEWFRSHEMLPGQARAHLPASTGIQGKRDQREACFMDVLGVAFDEPTRGQMRPMHSSRQNEATDYGSTLSRGMAVRGKDGRDTLHLRHGEHRPAGKHGSSRGCPGASDRNPARGLGAARGSRREPG